MINSIKYIIFWISLLRLFSLISSYTPYSECTQGRITAYDEYEEGGSCGFGIPKMYGAAPNEAFYNLGEKCGICYELVGPNGVLLFMVDSHCPVKGNEHSCSGDMLHFDLHKNGFDTIVDEGIGRLNVTFRMVSCDHESNMILKTKKDVSKYFFSFVILYHNIGLKKVYYSYDNETWTGLEREGDYNHWTIRSVELPLYIQLESISGEKVETTINEIIADNYYDTGVQFSVPNKMYDPFSLKEIKSPKVEGCCKLDDAYTDIYYEGKYLGEWQDISNCEPENEYSENCYEGKKCIKVNFKDWNVYQFFNRIQPETKRYNAIKFAIKTENTCDKCLKIKLDDYSFYSISTSEAGKWEEKVLTLEELGLTSSTKKFRKFMFQGSKKDSQIIYFDSIKLVKSDYDDQGECNPNTIQNNNISQDNQNQNSQTDSNNNINSDTQENQNQNSQTDNTDNNTNTNNNVNNDPQDNQNQNTQNNNNDTQNQNTQNNNNDTQNQKTNSTDIDSNDSQEKKDQDNISTIEDNELNKGEENNGSVILKESIECTQGRITAYDGYEKGGSCGFGIPKMYGAAPNEAFYNLGEKCGICYELVGPNGVLLFMVDSHCPVKGNEHSCSGDMLHFDLHKNGFDTIVDEGIGRLNVTFRMVSCDHESNMILKTKKDVSKYFFSFVILYHNIGLKKVYYSYDNETWTGLEREGDYNHWTIRSVELPLYIQLESISGEKVETTINEIIADNYYDTGVQFSVPNKMYDPFSLKEIKSPKVEGCCKLDDAYTDIYYEGKYLGEWQDISNCEPENEYSENCYEGKKCIKVNFKDWNVYQFFNRIQPETKRYNAIKFAIKTENTCDKCLKIKLDDYSFYSISTSEAGKWEEKVLTLEELGLTSSTKKFRKFMFQGSKKDSQIIYFDSIKLVKSDYDDQGECSINTIQDYNVYNDKENKATSSINIESFKLLIFSLIISFLLIGRN